MSFSEFEYTRIGSVAARKVARQLNKDGKIDVTGVWIADAKREAILEVFIKANIGPAECDAALATFEARSGGSQQDEAKTKEAPKQEAPKFIPPKHVPAQVPFKAPEQPQEAPKVPEAPMTATMTTKATSDQGMGALATLLTPFLKIEASLDEKKIAEMIQCAINQQDPKVLEVRIPGKDAVKVGRHHESFPKLLKLTAIRQHVMMVGPAGTGKSHSAEQAATALALPFYALSCGPQTTQAALLGYQSATGAYVETLFRHAYENGGVFLLDEVDSASGAVLVVLNSATSNGFCSFPDRMVKKHEDFVLICAGNTWGHGKTVEYVGRQALDGAFLDRMATLAWPIDPKLELDLAPVKEWARYCQKVREQVAKAGIKMLVTPRASISGGKAILGGFTPDECREMFILKGCDSKAAEIVNSVILPVIVTKEAEVA